MRRTTALIRLALAALLVVAVFQVPAAQSSECVEGRFKSETVGPMCSCDAGRKTPKDRYQCINGQWEYLYTFCGGPFCQGDPGAGDCSAQTPGSCPYGGGQWPPETMICPSDCYCCYMP